MGQLRQGADCGFNQPVARFVVHVGDQTKAAAVLFKVWAVERALQPLLSFHASLPTELIKKMFRL
jgi:hypothetical protein